MSDLSQQKFFPRMGRLQKNSVVSVNYSDYSFQLSDIGVLQDLLNGENFPTHLRYFRLSPWSLSVLTPRQIYQLAKIFMRALRDAGGRFQLLMTNIGNFFSK